MATSLLRLARHAPLRQSSWRAGIRLASTIVGKSGRAYVEGELLRSRKNGRNTFKAESGNESFVLKHAPPSFYQLSELLARIFSGTRGIRLAVDSSDEDNVLVYPYFRGSLFELIQGNPELSVANRKEVLRRLAEAICELHIKDCLHLDVKPQNVYVNWTCNDDGTKTITDVVLADFWNSWKVQRGEPYETRDPVGHIAWRSLEAHVGRAMTKASDMYSFGLVCAYALGGGDKLLLGSRLDDQPLTVGSPEEAVALTEVVSMQVAHFGPLTDGFFEKLNDENWSAGFKSFARLTEHILFALPESPFEVWGAASGPEAQDMIFGLTKSDPAARLTIDQVLEHPWWQKEADHGPMPPSPSRPTDAKVNTTTTRAPLRLLHLKPPTTLAGESRVQELTETLGFFGALYVEWIHLNFPRAAGYFHYGLGHLQTDITFTFPDETTGEPTQGTIRADQTHLMAVARIGDPRARDEDGRKRGGIVCVGMYVTLPERGAWVEGEGDGEGDGGVRLPTTYGSPAMEAAEKALEGACRVLAEKGYGEHGAVGKASVEGCIGVVVMGPGQSISEYSEERGFYDTPKGLVEEIVEFGEEGGGKK